MDRFWSKVNKTDYCWNWTASVNGGGYGKFKFNKVKVYAHRFSYELSNGPIPKGMHIDHLCRNKACVNPAHLEAVTCKENSSRSPFTVTAKNSAKTHCLHGHSLSGDNITISRQGKRVCLTCRRAYDRIRYYRVRRAEHLKIKEKL